MRLVLISMDAVFADDTDFLLSLPTLGKIAKDGVFCDNVQTIYPTLTYPIHTSLVTGCYPDRHGIAHNEPFQPEKPANLRKWHWDADEIQVDTLFTQAYKAGREVATILWPSTGHAKHIRFNFPEVLALPGEHQALKVLRYGSTGWLLKNELVYGRKRVSTKQPHLDDYATLMAEKLIERHETSPSISGKPRHMPDVLAVHLVDCDAMRHQYGVFSEEAKEALVRLDKRVGTLYEALRLKGLLKDTVFAIVTDHGHQDAKGSLPLDAWLRANQVPARAQSLGLGAYIRIRKADYRLVLQVLQDNKERLHLRHVYTREELCAMHAREDILLAVEPEESIVIVDEEDQEPHLATHGFGIDHPGAKTLLWLHGPQFQQGFRLPSCQLVDIAPTLASACGLTLDQAQGRVLEEVFKAHYNNAGALNN